MQESVTFYSKHAKLRIVMIPRIKTVVNNRFVEQAGVTIEFDRGEYETSDLKVIAFLRGNKNYGRDFFDKAEDLAAVTPPAEETAGTEELTVAKPRRTKKGEKATVAVKPTTAADVDDE